MRASLKARAFVSIMLDGQQRKQNRTGYGNDRNHIDHIVGCHRKHGGRRRWLRSRLCGRALWLRWHSLRSHGIPGNEEGLGQACFGCLTLTLSLSRFAPDLERTMTRPKPRMLNRAGKPKLMRGHGLRFRTSKGSQSSIGRPFLRKVCAIELKWCSLVFPMSQSFQLRRSSGIRKAIVS